jgi:multiple sugar transport system permease protein
VTLVPTTTTPKAPATGAVRGPGRAATVAFYVVAVVAAALFLFPLLWALVRSLQSSAVEGQPPTWSSLLSLSPDNYTGLLSAGGSSLWHYAGNSAIVALGTVVVSAVVVVAAGYALARLPFRGSGGVFVLLLAPFMVPFQAILSPLFAVLAWLHLTDSLIGLVLVYTVFQLPFSVYVMRNSFSAIPHEIEEAAIVDGASTTAVLLRVMLPLAVPGVVTVVLYAFLFGWNEFLGALMLLTSDNKLTLPVALNNLESGLYGQVNLGLLDAGAVIAMIPCVIVFLLLQRYYIRGITAGAVKS